MAWQCDYTDISTLKDFARIGQDNTDDDHVLSLAITAASRAIDSACNRQFGNVGIAAAAYFTPALHRDSRRIVIPIYDVQDIAGLTVAADVVQDGTYSTSITSYTLEPVNAVLLEKPFTHIYLPSGTYLAPHKNSVKVTAKWGWRDIPEVIENACLLQAMRFWKRRDAPFGVSGSPEVGGELRLLAKLDPDVALLVSAAGMRRWWAAG